jgi:F0F1-type ATP synthase delta subunit
MGRTKISAENRAKVVSFSADKLTLSLLNTLEQLTNESRSKIITDAIGYYHEFVINHNKEGQNES